MDSVHTHIHTHTHIYIYIHTHTHTHTHLNSAFTDIILCYWSISLHQKHSSSPKKQLFWTLEEKKNNPPI